MRTVAGIDPGNSGAIAIMRDHKIVATYKMPLLEEDAPVVRKRKGKATKVQLKVIDVRTLHLILTEWSVDEVYVERVAAMPGQGVTSMFTFGQSYGRILATAYLAAPTVHKVSPRVWQKEMFVHASPEAVTTKTASVEVTKLLHPEATLRFKGSKADHHGVADAVLLAHYGFNVSA
jgi:crossover junction endodeoxyribonuclease RuvC